jgi:RTX calcium-binding nonapeptide repeat (4 copies)
MRMALTILLSAAAAALVGGASPVLAGSSTTSLDAACTIVGTDGNDRLVGTDGPDVLCGLRGDDTLVGFGGGDVLRGGRGNDTLFGSAGVDTLLGGRGRDLLIGGRGADTLDGGTQSDECYESTGTVSRCESGTWPSTFSVVTDGTWRYSYAQSSGWRSAGFDDSAWDNVEAPSFGLCPDYIPSLSLTGSAAVPIWGHDPAEFQTLYARKTFLVAEPTVGTIRAWADDEIMIFVNGDLVAQEANGEWGPELTVEVDLRAGLNVIAVKVVDSAGFCQTVIADLTVL